MRFALGAGCYLRYHLSMTFLIRRAAYIFAGLIFTIISFRADFSAASNQPPLKSDSIALADPTIFYHNGTYYLYGTGAKDGFKVYTCADLINWKLSETNNGYALKKGDSFGAGNFWAPDVVYKNNKFYMAYTADQHIAIAQSDSPLGPFKQHEIKSVTGVTRQIDPYIFTDDDGKTYLYFVKVQNGNRIFVAELNDDLTDIKPETAKECITATDTWENVKNAAWPVTEGPTVLKHKNLYYLFYSANDFRNINYSVGYAVASNPYGPWKKYSGNPIISRDNIGYNGIGHGDFFKDGKGNWYYVLHTHRSATKVSPRLTGLVKAQFVTDGANPDKMAVDGKSFYYLLLK